LNPQSETIIATVHCRPVPASRGAA